MPSEYPYASKLEVHLEDIPVWMPGGAAKCSNCETIPTDLLYRPLREVLPISHLKLRLKKEIYLNDAGGSVFLGSSQRCYISFLQKYKGKVVSCDNTDGSPREFFISKKDIKIHNGATENGVTREQIDINPHLPLEEESDYELPGGISLRHTAHIQCAGDNTTTVQQLIDDLSPYYELENSSDLSAPRI